MYISFNKLFENNCLKYPENLAITYNNQAYSYEQLNQYAKCFSFFLKKRGVKRGTIVGVISKDYLARIVGIISLWKLGAAYLPIDPNYPMARINFILNDSKVSFVITENEIFQNFSLNHEVIPILIEENIIQDNSQQAIDFLDNQCNDIAYVAYTSGSTGNPKGALITQENVSSIYQDWKDVYSLTEEDKHLQLANFGFDVCSGDIIRALGSGAHLVICPPEIILCPEKIYELLVEKKITIAEFTPTVLRKLIKFLEQEKLKLSFMRLLICGSDSWTLKEYKEFQSFLNPKARLVNSYGTTETTIDSTYFEMKDKRLQLLDDQSLVPIGQPFPGTTVRIFDENLNDCLIGVPGEICIGGGGVSLGYLNQPKLTAEKFITISENNEDKIFYKTGDLGCYLDDKTISFLGRVDSQVKIMGYRVSLLEVEHTLNCYSGIKEAIVSTHSSLNSQEKFIVAFINCHHDFDINKCIHFLSNHLPKYAIPTVYLPVNSFPVSQHGKLDKNQLTSMLINIDEVNRIQDNFEKEYRSLNDNEKIILLILKKVFNICNTKLNNLFFNVSFNPIILAQILKLIESYCNIRLDIKYFINIYTINRLASLLNSKIV